MLKINPGRGAALNSSIKLLNLHEAIKTKPGINSYEVCGTPGYMAPEMLMKAGYTSKADIFSVGVILYAL